MDGPSSCACCDARVCPSCLSVRGAPPFSLVSWAWLALVALGSAASACAALAVAVSDTTPFATVFAATGGVLSVGNALMAADALLSENRLQVGLTSLWGALAAVFLVDCAYDPGSLGETWEGVRWWVVGFGAGPGLAQVLLAPAAAASQRYLTYRVAGADPRLQRQYDLFRSVLCLLKTDLLATLVVLSLALTVLRPDAFSWAELGISIGALVLSFALAWIGWLALVNESPATVAVFCAASLGQPALMAWKLWLLHQRPQQFASGVTFLSLGPACGVALAVRAALLGYTLVACRGFGSGLKEVAFAPVRRRKVYVPRRHGSDAGSVLSINGAAARPQPQPPTEADEEAGWRAAMSDDRLLGPDDDAGWG